MKRFDGISFTFTVLDEKNDELHQKCNIITTTTTIIISQAPALNEETVTKTKRIRSFSLNSVGKAFVGRKLQTFIFINIYDILRCRISGHRHLLHPPAFYVYLFFVFALKPQFFLVKRTAWWRQVISTFIRSIMAPGKVTIKLLTVTKI